MKRGNLFLTFSLVGHAVLAFAVGEIKQAKSREITAIQVAEAKAKPKPPEPAKVTPEPETKRERPSANRRPAPAPKPAEAAPPPPSNEPTADTAAAPDFGLSLSGGADGTGMALPGGGSPRGATTQPQRSVKRLSAAPEATPAGGCEEPLVKPKPLSVPQPAYTAAAREAAVEGRVRVELTVDASGRVISVRLLQGLGHGLDEAALAAARQASFEPGTRCGKPVTSTFKISMRFGPQ